jgi:hypothetical protein
VPLPLTGNRAHEVRTWAVSLTLHSCKMEDLLQAVFWGSTEGFLSGYLRDVAGRREDG